jgi:hypothetical protein
MKHLGTRTKLLLSLAVVLFGMFLFAETSRGERFLTGPPSDDQAISSGLAPIVYCAVPGCVLLLLSFLSYKADRRRVE